MKQLAGKRVLITDAGGALARASSVLFGQEGAAVAVVDVVAEAAEQTTRLVVEQGGEAVTIVADISDEAQAKRAVEEAVAALGGLDTLFNNAGIMPHEDRSVLDADLDLWRMISSINLQGHRAVREVRRAAADGGGQHEFLRDGDGLHLPAGRIRREQGCHLVADPLDGPAARAAAYPRQRARAGPHHDHARRAVLPRPRGTGGSGSNGSLSVASAGPRMPRRWRASSPPTRRRG